MLGCRSKGFSTSIWNYWNVNQRDSLLWSVLLPVKSQILELGFNWWVFSCSFAFEMCDLHLSLLHLNFIKKSLIEKRFFFWETFDFWNLEGLKLTFKNLRLWNFEDFDLKFGTWNLKFRDLGFWKLRLENLITKSGVWISFFKI